MLGVITFPRSQLPSIKQEFAHVRSLDRALHVPFPLPLRATPNYRANRNGAACFPDTRGMLFLAAVQQGRLGEWLGPEREREKEQGGRMHIEDRIEVGAKLPPTLLVHGTADTGVPVECADRLVKFLKERGAVVRPNGMGEDEDGWEPLMYVRVEGEEHGFDLDLGPEDADWVRKGLDFVEKVWLEDE